MKKLTILFFLCMAISSYAQEKKVITDKIEVLESTRDSKEIIEKVGNLFDKKVLNYSEMIMKINNKKYRCWGAGSNIRCLLTPG